MNHDSRHVRCLMHALNKAFECANLDCYGTQGINHRTLTQLLEDEFDDLTEEGVDVKVEFTTKAPRNFTRPTLSRWKSVSSVGKLVKKFFPVIYFMAVAVVETEDSGSYLHIIATELISLMVTKPVASTDIFVANPESLYKPGDTPPMYALTLWFVAFCEVYFDGMFDWLIHNDPHLGAGSYGQTARLCPEQAYIMHKLLSDLEEGGRKEKPEFAHFLKLVPGVSYAGEISDGRRKFVEKLPDQFIETFRYYLEKHALTP
jgi:hypothetical protein